MIKKLFILFILGLSGMLVAYSTILAGNTATVNATVTVQNVSLSVSPGSVNYGILPSNTSKSTCSSELNRAQTVTNDGNVTETFNIQGQNSGNWTLGATAGTDQYVHEFATSTCTTWPGGTALTTSYQTMATGIAPNGTATLNLRITTPISSSVFTEQNVSVTLQAVAQ